VESPTQLKQQTLSPRKLLKKQLKGRRSCSLEKDDNFLNSRCQLMR
jgi:hypothetical protein